MAYSEHFRCYICVVLVLAVLFNIERSLTQFIKNRTKVCTSMNIVALDDFEALRACKIIDGHIRIALLHLPVTAAASEKYAMDVEEISEYLFIYRVHNLMTLNQLFPKLRIIRGMALYADLYAFVVHENLHLRTLGLAHLVRIHKGHIRVTMNFQLCFVETIDWAQLLGNSTVQHLRIHKNGLPNACPTCVKPTLHCWDAAQAQRIIANFRLPYCPRNCTKGFCAGINNYCCDRNCVLQCNQANCELCGNLRADNKCVDQCPEDQVVIDARDCITHTQCRKLSYVVFNGKCVRHCPPKRMLRLNNTFYCNSVCLDDFVIRNITDLAKLEGCENLIGSLDIDIGNNMDPKMLPTLRRALSKIVFIDGYLKVQNSLLFLSLGFMDKLLMINGNKLIEKKYALYVVNNQHLEHIWNKDNNHVTIKNGNIFFHLNPRLCYETILELSSSLVSKPNITIYDVSPYSNGDRTVCDSRRTMNMTVEDRNATAIKIATNFFNYVDLYALVGYTYHYRESPEQNLSMYDERHACGRDNWHMDIQATVKRRHVIANLKPNTQYAIFVKALTRTDYHMKLNAYTDIVYVRTLPSRPNRVRKVVVLTMSHTEIKVLWWPPLLANGEISNYIVTYEQHEYKSSELENITEAVLKSYMETDFSNCDCPIKNPYTSGPMPNDADHYSRDTLQYDEMLPNIMYSKKGQRPIDPEYFVKVRGIQDTQIAVTTAISKLQPDNNNRTEERVADKYNETELYEMAKRMHEYNIKVDNETLQLQDDDYPLEHPKPVCSTVLRTNCVPKENYEGIWVDGNQYSIVIEDLLPGNDYRISVRACVKDVENGCSKPAHTYVRIF